MTKLSFSLKSLFFAVIVGLSLLLGTNAWAFGALLNQTNNSSIYADTTSNPISSEPVSSFSNSGFETGTGSIPQSPSNWKVIDNSTAKTPEASGIINLSQSYNSNVSKYKLEDYTKPIQRNSSENVLMINGHNTELYYGYESESSITLEANSYYQIEVAVYTDDAIASVYLSGADFDKLTTSKITQISTSKSWKNVTFFVQTNSTNNSAVKVQLYLGKKAHTNEATPTNSNGFVLFDDVTITRLSQQQFTSNSNIPTQYSTIVQLEDAQKIIDNTQSGFVQNGNFATNLQNWTEIDESTSGQVVYSADLNQAVLVNDESVVFGTHQSNLNSGVVLSTKNSNVGIKSADITIKQHQLYRISMWAKGKLESGNLNITLSGKLPETLEETTQSATITSLNTSTSAINGNWSLYEFYVEGHPLSDCTINLTLGLGTSSSPATGYIAIADINSYLVNTQQMSNGTSLNSNAKTLKMYPDATMTFNNYAFNLVEIENATTDITYPLTPKNWNAQNEANTKSGVVNIKSSIWNNQASLKYITRPFKTTDSSDNVLMLNASDGNYQAFTSEAITLSGSAYAKITFDANINSNSNAYVVITNKDNVVLSKIKLTKTSGWKNYSLYIQNYLTEQNITATLALGAENESVSGYAFFDNVKIDTSITEETFNDVVANDTNVYVSNLNSNWLDATDTNDTPLLWTQNVIENEQSANIYSGIIDYRNCEDKFAFINSTPGKATEDGSNNSLVINANSPVYVEYASNLTYTFNAETYYKLSVFVKTTNLTEDLVDDYTEDGQLITHGASIIVTGIDTNFTSINTANAQGENEWKEYIFYIYPTESTTSTIKLGLGCENMPTAGYAYFSNLNVSSLTEDEYNNEILEYDEENLPSNVLLATNAPKDDEEENAGSNFGNFDPFAFSTIIIAVAILVAIAGVFFKKFYRARPKKAKVVNNNYDRLQTLLKDVDRRERKTAINHKIKLLKEELEQSREFLAQEIAELQKQTDSYNTAKEIAKDNPNVQLEVPDVKQIQKNIEAQTIKIEQIELDIEILEDEKERINQQAKKDVEKTTEKLSKSENKNRK